MILEHIRVPPADMLASKEDAARLQISWQSWVRDAIREKLKNPNI